jgi:hypothetical protein
MKPINSHGFSRRWLGVGMSLVAALAAKSSTDVTFQIDMTSVSPAPTAVYISGTINGWPGFTGGVGSISPTNLLVNVSGTIWSNTFTVSDAAGTVESCKFQYEAGDNWESINNRQFILGTGTQVLPLTSWNLNTTWPPAPTNYVTFQCDMTPQVLTGVFTNGSSTLWAAGDSFPLTWQNGGAAYTMTNDPSLPGSLSNAYSGTFPQIGFPPASIQYKFRADGGWEDDQPTASKNREATITNSQVLPIVFYNNASLSDLILAPTWVTFALYCPNGTLDNGGAPFVKGFDPLYVNGNFFNASGIVVPAGTGSYWTWNTIPFPGGSGPASAQLFESAVPDVYTNSFLLPAGSKIGLTYKYSQDGFDDENGFQTNHFRVVRSIIPAPYSFPQDAWSWTVCPPGTPYPNPGISSTNIVEPDFGYLAIGAPSGGNLPLTWLGRQAVVIQHQSSLNGGVWITDNATDGLQATNWPNAGGNNFFRLMKKP